jgi:hypothetical protein
MKKIVFLIIAVPMLMTLSCEKSNSRKVSYFVTNSQYGFNVSYLDENNTIQSSYISTGSKSDKIVIATYMADP